MANKNIKLNSQGKVIEIDDSRLSIDESIILGQNVVVVPDAIINNTPFLYDPDRLDNVKSDPRTEFELTLQHGNLGTGCVTGVGITGCGRYKWNETIYQNVTTIETKSNGTTNKPIYDTTTKKFGNSSVNFRGLNGTTGSVLLIPNDSPGLTLAGEGGWSGDVLMSMWFNMKTTPLTDQVLLAQGNTSGGGTGNSFKLYYNSSSSNLQFDCNNQGDSPTGWSSSLVVAPSTSLTADMWHHVAVLYQSRWGAADSSNVIPYFNGASADHITIGVLSDLLSSDQPISIGGLNDGYYSFDGYIDDLHIRTGPSGGTVQAGYTGPTYTLPTSAETVDPDSTVALMRFDGVSGCSLFSVDTKDKVTAIVTHHGDKQENLVGIRDITLAGSATGGFDWNYGFVEGTKNFAHHQIACTGGTLMSAPDKKEIKKSQFRIASSQYRGLLGLSGNSGDSGDFLNLYGNHSTVGHGSPEFHGNDTEGFSIYLTDINVQRLSEHASYLHTLGGSAGSGGNYTLQDTLGNCVGFSGGHILALYQDVWTFRNNLIEDVILMECQVDSATGDASQSYSDITEIVLTEGGIDSGKVDGFSQTGNDSSVTSNYSTGTSPDSNKGGK